MEKLFTTESFTSLLIIVIIWGLVNQLKPKRVIRKADDPLSDLAPQVITPVFVISFFLYLLYSYIVSEELLIIPSLLAAIITAILAAPFNRVLSKIVLPLIVLVLIQIFFTESFDIDGMMIGFAAGTIIVLLSIKLKFLTISGSLFTLLTAMLVYGLGGLKWSIPLLTFFLLSSILSKVKKKLNPDSELKQKKSGTRDYMQVLANGGTGVIILLVYTLWTNELFYFLYVSSLAAVCADTWSTEFGTIRKVPTYSILSFRRLEQGLSGGISVNGTLGAVMGALTIGLSAFYWINIEQTLLIFVIFIAGISGSFIDSYLGVSFQLKYRCRVCGTITERSTHCQKLTTYESGFRWLDNDVVNLLASVSGVVIFLLLYILVKNII